VSRGARPVHATSSGADTLSGGTGAGFEPRVSYPFDPGRVNGHPYSFAVEVGAIRFRMGGTVVTERVVYRARR